MLRCDIERIFLTPIAHPVFSISLFLLLFIPVLCIPFCQSFIVVSSQFSAVNSCLVRLFDAKFVSFVMMYFSIYALLYIFISTCVLAEIKPRVASPATPCIEAYGVVWPGQHWYFLVCMSCMAPYLSKCCLLYTSPSPRD